MPKKSKQLRRRPLTTGSVPYRTGPSMSQPEMEKEMETGAFGLHPQQALMAVMMVFVVVFAAMQMQSQSAAVPALQRSILGDEPALRNGTQTFEQMDTDKDASLNEAEITAGMNLQEKDGSEAIAIINRYDADPKDGTLNETEYAPLFARWEKFAAVDADGNGSLTEAELKEKWAEWSTYDTAPKDGSVNLAEYLAWAPRAFAEIDGESGDGKLTADEISSEMGVSITQAQSIIHRYDGDPKDGELDSTEYAPLQKNWEQFAAHDTDRDGQLTKAELGDEEWAKWEKFDTDPKDGSIDLAEFLAAEVSPEADDGDKKRTADEISFEPKKIEERDGESGDASEDALDIKKDVAEANKTQHVTDHAHDDGEPKSRPLHGVKEYAPQMEDREKFAELDKDNDGTLTRDEVKASKAVWAHYDADGDAQIELREYLRAKVKPLRFKEMDDGVTAAEIAIAMKLSNAQAHSVIDSYDSEPKDGTLTKREYKPLYKNWKKFAAMDTDGDGTLTKAEMPEKKWKKWETLYDANQDGNIDLAEYLVAKK